MFVKRNYIYVCAALLMAAVIVLSILGPSIISIYNDTTLLENVIMEPLDNSTVGYRYSLNANERLFILSAALESQNLPQSSYALSAKGLNSNTNLQNPEASYAFVKNYRGPSHNELTLDDILNTCSKELAALCDLNIIPAFDYKIMEGNEIVLYSALDILEPQKKVSIWQMNFVPNRQSNLENTLLDACIDAETGKLYEFSIRIQKDWEDLNPDEMMEAWCSYLNLGNFENYEPKNPPMESTPYYKKYMIEGMGTEKIMVTIGFYKGINELFFKVNMMQK